MYLAKVLVKGKWRILIRQSYFDERLNCYDFKQIFDLGENPSNHIHQLTEKTVYFDEALENAVEKECKKDPTTLLEELLWDYLPLEQRQMIKDFHRGPRTKLSPLSAVEQEEVQRYIHIFDRRRLFYIRYGAVDQSRIYRLNDKIYRPLLYKCRDEKERYLNTMERSLASTELKKYIFVIFNLQQRFSEMHSSFMPEALDHEKMDESFLEEICRLNDDPLFWQDGAAESSLREQLQGYLIRYFDSDFASPSYAHDFYMRFRARHRRFKWPERKEAVTEEETSEIFGEKISGLRKLNRLELLRIFRKKAKQYHPDRGGTKEQFITLLNAYEQLKKRL